MDAEGKPVKDPYSYQNLGGLGFTVTLKPGEGYSERLYLGHWCTFEKQGEYRVTCQRSLGDDTGKAQVAIEIIFPLSIATAQPEAMKKVIAELGKKVDSDDRQAVYEATIALSSIQDETVVPFLAASLTKGDLQNKRPAVEGLSRFGGDAIIDALTVALKDVDQFVREAAGRALMKMKDSDRAVDALLKELANATPDARATATRALGATKSRKAYDALAAALYDHDPNVRYAAAEALGSLGNPAAQEVLKTHATGKDMAMRVAAVKGLVALKASFDPEWLTVVIRGAVNVNDQNFHEAIRLIRLYAPNDARRALAACVKFDDPSPRTSYNMFLLLAIDSGPQGYYSRFYSDPNTDGTPEQIENNRKVLAELKAWLEKQRWPAPQAEAE